LAGAFGGENPPITKKKKRERSFAHGFYFFGVGRKGKTDKGGRGEPFFRGYNSLFRRGGKERRTGRPSSSPHKSKFPLFLPLLLTLLQDAGRRKKRREKKLFLSRAIFGASPAWQGKGGKERGGRVWPPCLELFQMREEGEKERSLRLRRHLVG